MSTVLPQLNRDLGAFLQAKWQECGKTAALSRMMNHSTMNTNAGVHGAAFKIFYRRRTITLQRQVAACLLRARGREGHRQTE